MGQTICGILLNSVSRPLMERSWFITHPEYGYFIVEIEDGLLCGLPCFSSEDKARGYLDGEAIDQLTGAAVRKLDHDEVAKLILVHESKGTLLVLNPVPQARRN